MRRLTQSSCLLASGLHRVTRLESTQGTERGPAQRKRGSRRSRSASRKNSRTRSNAQAPPSPLQAPATNYYGETQVPMSMDIGAVESLMDVEKFFPDAIAHLKAHHATSSSAAAAADIADNREERLWRDITHTVNADGYRPVALGTEEDAAAKEPSFFDQRSLDIRGGLKDSSQDAHRSPLPSRAERLSPDVLQLTGGQPHRHGLALAAESNAAPADQTLEVEDDNFSGKNGDSTRVFGDTPVQLTDMLRERLMELKRDKLQADRSDTFLPRRLPLMTDAEVARARARQSRLAEQQQQLLDLATHHDKRRGGGTGVARTAVATLENWEAVAGEGNDGSASSDTGFSVQSAALALTRDGASREQQALAASALRRVEDYLPRDNASNLDDTLAHDLAGMSGSSDANGHSQGRHGKEGVHLLRVLPRASFCSRREAGVIIASGQVKVNNVVERNPFRVVQAEDDVLVAGHPSRLRFAPPRLWMYHKPANVVVSRNDVAGRTLIGKHARILGMDHLIPVGSLPMRAHGLLLLTNDGELSQYLENPRANIQQTYLLRVRPAIGPLLAHRLNTEGIHINGKLYKDTAEFIVTPGTRSRYSVKVKVRGESMPVAHLMQHLGRTVERGGRVSYGPFTLSTLPVGSIREVTVPSFYTDHLSKVWGPFVERDWPYFRRQRVGRLRRLARFRQLNPKELEELDQYTYEEVQDALSFDAQELASAAESVAASGPLHRPSYHTGMALARDFPQESFSSSAVARSGRADVQNDDIDSLSAGAWVNAVEEEGIIEDITAVA